MFQDATEYVLSCWLFFFFVFGFGFVFVVGFFFFFFQAEDGIRDVAVTGVQTCALPIYVRTRSYFDNSELASTGIPEGPVLDLLQPHRGQLPEEVFTTVFEDRKSVV